MNLTTYVQRLQEELGDSATRMVLLEALSAAADEITGELAPGSVEVRLRSGEPEFVVTAPRTDDDYGASAPLVEVPASDESGTARLNLRLPENLKERIEQAASAEGLSLNAWLIRAAHAALVGHSQRRIGGGRDQFTGWVR